MLGTVTDETLVARALAGSNGAWTKLVKRYEKRVYNYALRMVGHPDDALDLMQEVFVGVHRNLSSFRGDGAFPAWLFRIASFRCTDYLRRRKQHEEYDDERAFAADPDRLLRQCSGVAADSGGDGREIGVILGKQNLRRQGDCVLRQPA